MRGVMPCKMTRRERELEFFETPPHYIAALLNEVNIFGRVYEPCVGEGAIADALKKLGSVRKVVTNDIDKKRKADTHKDATHEDAWGWNPSQAPDWAVTNPPFSDELPIIENALECCPNVAFLARLSFLEPTEDREYFLATNPPSQVIVLPRYSFRPNDEGKKKTDSVTCAWLVWLEDRQPRPMKFYARKAAETAAILRGLSE